MNQAKTDTLKINEIRGGVILPVISLLFVPISFYMKAIHPFFENHAPYVIIKIYYLILFLDILVLLLASIVAYQFYIKTKIAPALYIIYVLFMILIWNVTDGLMETPEDPPFISMFFHAMVIVPILVYSKKPGQLFIQDLDRSVFVNRIVIPINNFLQGFWNFVYRTRKVLYVWIILYLALVVILNCMLRAIRIDGDITQTFNYL